MSFIETHKPCSVCNSSDGASINEDGTAKCFSCGTFYTYEGGEMIQAPKLVKDNVAITEGDFNALHDRGISLTTAKKYGVRSVVNSSNEVSRHFYPYYNGSALMPTSPDRKQQRRLRVCSSLTRLRLWSCLMVIKMPMICCVRISMGLMLILGGTLRLTRLVV